MRLAFALLIASVQAASAGPPAGYTCGAGKPLVGTGCQCPVNYAPARDGEDIAICIVKVAPAPKPEPPPTTAQQAFEQAERWYRELQKLPELKGTVKDVTAQIALMTKATTDLAARYDGVNTFKDPSWSLSALTRRGDIYDWIARRLLSSPVPRELKKLGDDAADQYMAQIERVAVPFEDKAVAAWTEALKKAKELAIWNDQLANARQSLAKYRPDEFPPFHVTRMPASTTVDPADAGRWNDVAVKFLGSQAFADAKEAAEKSLSKTPGFVKAQVNLANALRGLEKWDEAEAAYQKAITADAKSIDARYNFATLYLDLPRKGVASQDLLARYTKARTAALELQAIDPKAASELVAETSRLVDRMQKTIDRERKRLEKAPGNTTP